MIDGVQIKRLKVIPDDRGRLMEILRCDEAGLFERFGQVYVSYTYPGVVKGWHMHRQQTDHMACLVGMLKLVLYDGRDGSPTRGEVQEIYFGIHQPLLVKIPPGVWHGWQNIGPTEAMAVNIPDAPYDYDDPDEHRKDPHQSDIPYDWTRKDR